MPSLALFCPDGSIYTLNTLDSTSVNWPINVTEEMNYGNFLTADGVTDAFENLCGTMIDDENVSGTVTLNLDICEENLELPLDNIVVTFSDGTNTQIRTTNKFGYYEAFLADGTYDISFSNPSNLMSICLEPVSVNVSGNVTTGLNAVYTADVYCPETTLSINPWLIRPCGIASFVSVEICNVGTADLDEYELFVNLPVNSTVISANTENSYNYDPATGVFSSFCDSVAIFECRTYQIGFYAPCETTPGDTVCFSMEINPLSLLPSCDYLQTTDSLCAVVVGSYDPNDKTGLTLGKGVENYIDAGTEIEYMIRFQNTGTDTAFVVRIEDMISPVFDPTTIRPISSSHEYEMTYGDDKLVFHFPNILLVDSFKNEPESHGFIVFKINLRENLEPGTEILNNAGIYFDGNEPVITNTYKYVVTIPTRLIETNFTSFSVYPNPTQNSINIDLSSLGLQYYDVTISNLQGQKILEQGSNDQIIKMDVQSLNTGLYFITVKDNEGRFVAVEKFIKE